MARILALAVVSLALLALPATASAGLIALRIDFRATQSSVPRITTLRCADRATGTVPRPAAACKKLITLGDRWWEPVPKDVACTAIYGGPGVVRITGISWGRTIWVKFKRTDGCSIDRWERIAFMLPPPTGLR